MTAATVKDRATGAPDAADATVPEIPPANVRINWHAQKNKGLFVHVPEGMIASDLQEPGVWKKVQNVANIALAKYDDLQIFGHDDAWYVHAMVTRPTKDGAYIKILKSTSFAEAGPELYQDDEKRVVFRNGAYWVENKKSGRIEGHGHSSEALARRALIASYPQKVGT